MATTQEQWELERAWVQRLRERIIAAQIPDETAALSWKVVSMSVLLFKSRRVQIPRRTRESKQRTPLQEKISLLTEYAKRIERPA